MSLTAQRKLERVFSRQEYRRAFPGEIAELTYPPRVVEAYTHALLGSIDMNGVRGAGLKVVADCAGGTASLVLPGLLGRIGVDVLTVNNRLDEASPTQSLASASGSIPWGSGSPSSTTRAPWSATSGRCSSCWT